MARLRAQGAVEYLVMIAGALVVALVAAYLLGFFPGVSSDMQTTASKAYWTSARPTGAYEAQTVSSACEEGSGYTMVLENHETTPIRMTGISIDGQALAFCRPGQAPTSEIVLDTYQRTAIDVPATILVTAGKSITVNISISYVSGYGLPGVQRGSKPLIISNDLPIAVPGACANIGETCSDTHCCSGGHCFWRNAHLAHLCYTCGGATNGTCPPPDTCGKCGDATYHCSTPGLCSQGRWDDEYDYEHP